MTIDTNKGSAKELEAKILAKKGIVHPYSLEQEAGADKIGVAKCEWIADIDPALFFDDLKAKLDTEFLVRAKPEEAPLVINKDILVESCGILSDVISKTEAGKVKLVAIAFEDGSGAFSYDFTDAPATQHYLQNLASPILNAIFTQKETESSKDISDMDFEDILADAEQKSLDDSRISKEVLMAHMIVVQDALTKFFKPFSACSVFEPGLSSLAVSECAEVSVPVGVKLSREGVPFDFPNVALFFREPGVFQSPVVREVPKKDYASMGQMAKANDAQALSDYIDAAKEQGIWGDSHEDNCTQLLWHACAMGAVDVIRVILEKTKADEKVVDDNGFNCLLAAAANGQANVIEYLVQERKFNVESSAGNGMNGLMLAAANGHLDAINAFLKVGADINYVDLQNRTALHWAADSSQMESCKLLIEKGIDPNIEECIDSCIAAEYVDEENDELYNLLEQYRHSLPSVKMKI